MNTIQEGLRQRHGNMPPIRRSIGTLNLALSAALPVLLAAAVANKKDNRFQLTGKIEPTPDPVSNS